MVRFLNKTVITLMLLSVPQEFGWAMDGSSNGLFVMATAVTSTQATRATDSTTRSTESIVGSTIDSKTGDGALPLHHAAMQGDYQQVSDIARRTNIDQRTGSGKTALHLMVLIDDRAMIAHLLRLGASVHSEDDKGKKPIDYWEAGNDVRILTMLQACEMSPPESDCPRAAK